MGKMYLMCGLSGVGKTTFSKDFIKKNPGIIRLSIDNYYEVYRKGFGVEDPWSDPDISFRVWIQFFQEIHQKERYGCDVIIDTNAPTYVKRRQFIDWFPNFEEHNLIFIHAEPELCIKNNLERSRTIPRDEMEKMVLELELPGIVDVKNRIFISTEGCWDKIIPYYNNNNNFILLQER